MKTVFAAAAALVVIAVAPAHAGSFLGATVDGSYYYPNSSSLFEDGGDAVVSPSAGFNFATGSPNTTATVTADQITITFSDAGGFYTPASFNGVVITDLSAADITGVTLDSASTVIPVLSFTDDSVGINLSSLQPGNSDTIVVDVSFGGVPEPAAWALMLAGFAGLGAAMRVRRRTLAAAA